MKELSPRRNILYNGECDDSGDARWDRMAAAVVQLYRLEIWV